jgi:hypothetical protein
MILSSAAVTARWGERNLTRHAGGGADHGLMANRVQDEDPSWLLPVDALPSQPNIGREGDLGPEHARGTNGCRPQLEGERPHLSVAATGKCQRACARA